MTTAWYSLPASPSRSVQPTNHGGPPRPPPSPRRPLAGIQRSNSTTSSLRPLGSPQRPLGSQPASSRVGSRGHSLGGGRGGGDVAVGDSRSSSQVQIYRDQNRTVCTIMLYDDLEDDEEGRSDDGEGETEEGETGDELERSLGRRMSVSAAASGRVGGGRRGSTEPGNSAGGKGEISNRSRVKDDGESYDNMYLVNGNGGKSAGRRADASYTNGTGYRLPQVPEGKPQSLSSPPWHEGGRPAIQDPNTLPWQGAKSGGAAANKTLNKSSDKNRSVNGGSVNNGKNGTQTGNKNSGNKKQGGNNNRNNGNSGEKILKDGKARKSGKASNHSIVEQKNNINSLMEQNEVSGNGGYRLITQKDDRFLEREESPGRENIGDDIVVKRLHIDG